MHAISIPKTPPERPGEVRVTIAIGAAVILQTALALIWTGAASERLAQLERRADANAVMLERTARLEEQVGFISVTLTRVEEKIDRQAEGSP